MKTRRKTSASGPMKPRTARVKWANAFATWRRAERSWQKISARRSSHCAGQLTAAKSRNHQKRAQIRGRLLLSTSESRLVLRSESRLVDHLACLDGNASF